MRGCNLPYGQCVQQFWASTPGGQRHVIHDLRKDMAEWIRERCGKRWSYSLKSGSVEFMFDKRGMAALLILEWIGRESRILDVPTPWVKT